MTDRNQKWFISLIVAVIAVAILLLHGSSELRYDRADILHGQIWRVFTGNFVHANWRHLASDLAGLLLWTALASYMETRRSYLIILIASGLGVGLGLLVLDPQVGWYVGLSGILHGLFAASAIRLLSRKEWLGGLALTAAIALKLMWEQRFGDLGTAKLLGVPVLVDAHLYGAVTGAVIVLALLLFRR
ncbi:rhombosortase [Halothiobacillus sp.]|jgi:rhomboid family GlyGly-CTERM serine protease|uniref:rhombosortase n=1 Tax=Halothiobacillus sp. TaxID=1891311 RepID=UPI002983F036|nr:rhombosortase [Halothiobacillus sp.]MDY0147450.1 rhombosortase [Halothiobacillus sp.]